MVIANCSCNQSFELDDQFAGKTIRCPSCQQPLRVPNLDPKKQVKKVTSKKRPSTAAPQTSAPAKQPTKRRPQPKRQAASTKPKSPNHSPLGAPLGDPLGLDEFSDQATAPTQPIASQQRQNLRQSNSRTVPRQQKIARKNQQTARIGNQPSANQKKSKSGNLANVNKGVWIVFLATISYMVLLILQIFSTAFVFPTILMTGSFVIANIIEFLFIILRTGVVFANFYGLILCLGCPERVKGRAFILVSIGLMIFGSLFDWGRGLAQSLLSIDLYSSATSLVTIITLRSLESAISQSAVIFFLFFLANAAKHVSDVANEGEARVLAYVKMILIVLGILSSVVSLVYGFQIIGSTPASGGDSILGPIAGLVSLVNFFVMIAWIIKYIIFLYNFKLSGPEQIPPGIQPRGWKR